MIEDLEVPRSFLGTVSFIEDRDDLFLGEAGGFRGRRLHRDGTDLAITGNRILHGRERGNHYVVGVGERCPLLFLHSDDGEGRTVAGHALTQRIGIREEFFSDRATDDRDPSRGQLICIREVRALGYR